MHDHLTCKPFSEGYAIWYLNGESHPKEMTNILSNVEFVSQSNILNVQDPIRDMVDDAFGVHEHHFEEGSPTLTEGVKQSDSVTPNVNQDKNVADEFYELSNDGQLLLYEGCENYSKLSY